MLSLYVDALVTLMSARTVNGEVRMKPRLGEVQKKKNCRPISQRGNRRRHLWKLKDDRREPVNASTLIYSTSLNRRALNVPDSTVTSGSVLPLPPN